MILITAFYCSCSADVSVAVHAKQTVTTTAFTTVECKRTHSNECFVRTAFLEDQAFGYKLRLSPRHEKRQTAR